MADKTPGEPTREEDEDNPVSSLHKIIGALSEEEAEGVKEAIRELGEDKFESRD